LAFVWATIDPLWASPRAQCDGAAAASNRPGTCTEWLPGPRQVCLMSRTFSGGQGTSILHQMWGNWPLFRQPFTLYVHRPGLNATGRRLLQTDLIRAQGGSQDPGRCVKCLGPSVGGPRRDSSTRVGVIGPYFGSFGPSDCNSSGRSFVVQKKQTFNIFL
jgi:hypothetical protein